MTAAGPSPPALGPGAAGALMVGILLPLAAGALAVLGFAPFYLWQAPVVAVALLLHAWRQSGSPLQAALSGFAFGLGYFLAGVSWVYVSLHVFGSMPAVLAGLATFLFCAYLAIFFAAAGWVTARFAPAGGARRVWLGTAAVVAMEWLRGWLFTGFPWLNLGTSQAPDGPLAGYVPVLGNYGASLGVAVLAACLVTIARRRDRAAIRIAGAVGFVVLVLSGLALSRWEWTRPAGPAVTMALLQGNVPQEMKWREEVRTATLLAYRDMIAAAKARVVVVPETALPAFLDQLPADYLEEIRARARADGKEVLLGVVERLPGDDGLRYYNSLVRLTGANESYRKRHLVPFGEFIPPGFKFVLAVLKIPMSDFARGGAGQAPLEAAGVRFGVAICYEDIFGEEVIESLPAAQVLVNVSNDAWFGRSFAAEQHLQSSQMRALESGRWMVRSTNTGATAAIDERGRVVSRLPWFTAGTLVAEVTPREGLTPYARWGNFPALLLVLAVGAAAIRGRRRR